MENKPTFLSFQVLLLICSVIMSLYFKQYLILLIAIIPCYYIFCHKYHWSVYAVVSSFVVIVIALMFLIPQNWKMVNLAKVINNGIPDNLRQISINYLENNYSEQGLTFIKMLLFNEKGYTDATYEIFRDLGVLHLFVVSGLHVSLLSSGFNKIFKRCPKFARIVNLNICILLWYFSNFSLPILRIILITICSFFKYMRKFSGFAKNCLVGIFICVLTIRDAAGYSFILTFLCTLTIVYICEQTESPIIRFLSINLVIFIITLPIVITFNSNFNALAFLNNFAFSWFIMAIYILELLFVWIPPLSAINEAMIINVIRYFEVILNAQQMVYTSMHQHLIVVLYLLLFALFDWNWNRKIISQMPNQPLITIKPKYYESI